ncbi:hypothetical protein ACJX0J_013661, partial [Zea mays]
RAIQHLQRINPIGRLLLGTEDAKQMQELEPLLARDDTHVVVGDVKALELPKSADPITSLAINKEKLKGHNNTLVEKCLYIQTVRNGHGAILNGYRRIPGYGPILFYIMPAYSLGIAKPNQQPYGYDF